MRGQGNFLDGTSRTRKQEFDYVPHFRVQG